MTKEQINKLSLIASNCGLPECHRNWLHEIIEKEKKFAWHDLRENPEDLPPLTDYGVASEYVLVKVKYGRNDYSYCDTYLFDTGKEYKWATTGKVVAWRYIDTEESEDAE